jgi:hypothetical protein
MEYRGSCHCGKVAYTVAAISIRCLEDFDIGKIPVKQVNGKAF